MADLIFVRCWIETGFSAESRCQSRCQRNLGTTRRHLSCRAWHNTTPSLLPCVALFMTLFAHLRHLRGIQNGSVQMNFSENKFIWAYGKSDVFGQHCAKCRGSLSIDLDHGERSVIRSAPPASGIRFHPRFVCFSFCSPPPSSSSSSSFPSPSCYSSPGLIDTSRKS